MNPIQERFKDAADTGMPPSRLSAEEVYAAAWRQRRRRVGTWTAAGLVAALVVAVVGIDVLRSSGDDRVAVDPTTAGEEPPPWLRDGAVVTAVATDADHLYAVTSVCRPNGTCSYRLVGSDDGGATWSVRQETFGEGVTRDVYAPAAGVLLQVQSRANLDYREADPASLKMTVQEKISTDGGRSWTELRRVTTPVDAVPDGGWLACEDMLDEPCANLIAYDPAGARSAPLRNGPGVRVIRVAEVPSAVGFWLTGHDPGMNRRVTATSPDRGRTWSTHADDDLAGPVTVDGVTGYAVASDSYAVVPTGPNPTKSPSESKKRVYRTGDGGRTWQRVDPDGTLPDGALDVAQTYVASDGTPVVLMTDVYDRPNPAPFERYTSDDDGRTFRSGGVTGLGATLSRDSRTGGLVRTSVAGVYLAHDDEVVYRSIDGLRWTRHPVNPPR